MNYYTGDDSGRWLTGIPTYGKLSYKQIYPGIDLEFHGDNGEFEYDFILAPGADPNVIQLAFSGAAPTLNESGLLLHVASHEFRFRSPVIYQDSNGKRRSIQGGFRMLADGKVGFHVGPYDRSLPLVIDPVLAYSSYLPGNGFTVHGVAADSGGNMIVVGETATDGFVMKLDRTGKQILYTTYLGGSSFDGVRAVVTDQSQNVFVAGNTSSKDFPTSASAFARSCASFCSSSFAAKLGPAGELVYGTYVGASNAAVHALTIDTDGNAYLTGTVASLDLPLVGAFQSSMPEAESTSASSAFVQKLNANGSGLLLSSYLGGRGRDIGTAIAVDETGSIFVAGTTESSDFPVKGASQLPPKGRHIFLTKLTPDGQELVYSILLGGSGGETLAGMSLGSNGRVYLTGRTDSPDFPLTRDAFKSVCRRDGLWCTGEAFLTAVRADRPEVTYSTFLAEALAEQIVADGNHVYVVGRTSSPDFPLVNSMQTSVDDVSAFVMEMDSTGAVVFSTLLGGRNTSADSSAIAVRDGSIIVAGTVTAKNNSAPDYPLQNPITSGIPCCGIRTPFMARITPASGPVVSVSPLSAPMVTIRNVGSSPLYMNPVQASLNFELGGDCGYSLPTGGDCIVYLRSLDSSPTGTLTVDSNAGAKLTLAINKWTALDPNRPAVLLLSPATVNFPPVLVGQDLSRSVRIRNVGLNSVGLAIAADRPFQVSNSGCYVLGPGGSCNINVSFAPENSNAVGGALTVNGQKVFLKGSGTGIALVASADSINFGTQYVSMLGPERIVTFQNASSGPVALNQLQVSGNFQTTSHCPPTLAPFSECRVSLAFVPTTNANYQGTLTASFSGGAASVALTGIGRILSDLSLSDYLVNFGNAQLNVSTTRSLTITNNSSHTIKLSDVVATAPFAAKSNCNEALPAGSSCALDVSFAPGNLETFGGQLSIIHDGLGSPQQVALAGTGQGPIRISLATVEFGDQQVGTTSGKRHLSISNNTNNPVTFAGISISGDEFSLVSNPCTTLPRLYGCAPQFTFTPKGTGIRQAIVTITTATPPFTLATILRGNGVVPQPVIPTQVTSESSPTSTAPPPLTPPSAPAVMFGEQAISAPVATSSETDSTPATPVPASTGVGGENTSPSASTSTPAPSVPSGQTVKDTPPLADQSITVGSSPGTTTGSTGEINSSTSAPSAGQTGTQSASPAKPPSGFSDQGITVPARQ
ncbi:MAG: choice-of-anchor D domain-containing protein [Candidatus Korobacteraceae bacterium]